MGKFGLRSVYITNAVKCGKAKAGGKFEPFTGGAYPVETKVRKKCWEHFLSREIQLHKPAVVFAFGWKAYRCCDLLHRENPHLPIYRMLHPSARMSSERLRLINDETVLEVLRSIGEIHEV